MEVGSRPYPVIVASAAAGFAISFGIFGSICNTLMIIAFLKHGKLREKPTTVLILNLTISDLMFSLVNLPILAGLFFNDDWLNNSILCKLSVVLYYGNINVSLFSMEAIAINRCILILNPVIYKKIYTSCKISIMLVFIWVLSFLPLLLPTLEIWGSLGFEKKTFMCDILPKNDTTPKTIFSIILGFILPCLIISISYFLIYMKIKNNRKKLNIHSQSNTIDSSELRVKKFMLIIIFCFLICFFPPVLLIIFDSNYEYPIFRVIDTIIFWVSVLINPFIYSYSNRSCKNAIKQLFAKNVITDDCNFRGTSRVMGQISLRNPNTNC